MLRCLALHIYQSSSFIDPSFDRIPSIQTERPSSIFSNSFHNVSLIEFNSVKATRPSEFESSCEKIESSCCSPRSRREEGIPNDQGVKQKLFIGILFWAAVRWPRVGRPRAGRPRAGRPRAGRPRVGRPRAGWPGCPWAWWPGCPCAGCPCPWSEVQA